MKLKVFERFCEKENFSVCSKNSFEKLHLVESAHTCIYHIKVITSDVTPKSLQNSWIFLFRKKLCPISF